MAHPVRELSPKVITYVAILASCMMVAKLIRTPHTIMTYLTILMPLPFLFAIWNSHRALSGALWMR